MRRSHAVLRPAVRHQTAELNGYLLELIGARALICHASLTAGLEHAPNLIVYGGDPPEGALAYEALLSTASTADPGLSQSPAELENAIASHPAVLEVSVVGVPHERWGETPLAAVVLHDGAAVGARELIELTRERCGSVKKVTRVVFVAEIPKSAVGKILRREVRERHWHGGESWIAGV